ncbi:MAG: nitrite reductase [Myxococcales bacterium]|jgi:nitrite reductase (NADH) small subunit|nr:nitrite reductase [Myxococcales bacterium]
MALPVGTREARPANENENEDAPAGAWVAVCALDDIVPDTGVCALVRGQQVALVRVGVGDAVFAISNFDPFSDAFVLARGIVGDRAGVAKIASPLYKQSFDLRTGQCLDDPTVSVPVWPARVRQGQVEVRVEVARL